ncbi:diacylglycerol kinase [Ramlibacter sp. AW1]|uniref:Diacylglycerol kinase n=1 Tax=Ramlibacter aurantiacus TaxID=2801330 RepID=A0A937D5X0_9BURK|nr:diacylglycerol kinase family protein [Ramlibacter aurantiacus]MBL0420353.1 diacylglycerol kinase [Ramlibacter aurantiacus]
MKRLLVIMNPASGSGAADAAERRGAIEQGLREAGADFDFIEVRDPGQLDSTCRAAAERARREDAVLVAVGGDGTITTAAQAAHQAGCVMGAIPQGTFNYFCRVHGIPQDLERAVKALARAEPRQVHVGAVNSRLFLVNASLGMYPQLLDDREDFLERFGRRRWVALAAALATLVRWRHQLRVEVEADGQVRQLRTPMIFVGNNPLQLARLGLDAGLVKDVGHGSLAALVLRPIGTWAMLGLLLRGALGRLGEADQLESFTFQRLTVRMRGVRRTKVAADGEIGVMTQPIRFEVCEQPLTLMLPCAEDRVEVE